MWQACAGSDIATGTLLVVLRCFAIHVCQALEDVSKLGNKKVTMKCFALVYRMSTRERSSSRTRRESEERLNSRCYMRALSRLRDLVAMSPCRSFFLYLRLSVRIGQQFVHVVGIKKLTSNLPFTLSSVNDRGPAAVGARFGLPWSPIAFLIRHD
jgi:hypothetical protein